MTKTDALANMRLLTERGVPFSVGFVSCNTTNKTSNGYVEIAKVMLRQGFSKVYSDKAGMLIGYTNVDTNEDRHFYLPLLMKFNGITLRP